MKQIPNLFTLLNLFFGALAIIFILQPGSNIAYLKEGGVMIDLPEKIAWGSICIGIAAVIDFLDGLVARLLKAPSEMGKQLDSLADVVSFGVAPGMILYQLLRMSYLREASAFDTSYILLLPALLVPCCAAWRLAKFNLDTEQTEMFKGLPTPSAGLAIAALPLVVWFNQFNLEGIILNRWFLYAFILLISWLMVSRIRLMSLKFKDFSFGNNLPRYLLLIIGLLLLVFLQWIAAPLIILVYIILSLLFKNKV